MDKYYFEKVLWNQGYKRVMGLDEVGRGCLCGPVVAAGVILKPVATLDIGIADSKKIQKRNREKIAEKIKENAVFWTIQHCSAKEIDELNILRASIKAMLKCAGVPDAKPDYLLVDGNRFTSSVVPHSCIVKGDDRSATIGAASILAKVYRDEWMERLHQEYPYYGWNTNVGYPTQKHFEGLKEYGMTEHHRKSFKLGTSETFNR